MNARGNLHFVRLVAWTGLAALALALAYALTSGHLATDAQRLLVNPWGLATLIDIYVGFALFSCWIVWRERHKGRAAVWVALVLATGNLASTLYVLLALRESSEDVESFWHGRDSTAGGLEDEHEQSNRSR